MPHWQSRVHPAHASSHYVPYSNVLLYGVTVSYETYAHAYSSMWTEFEHAVTITVTQLETVGRCATTSEPEQPWRGARHVGSSDLISTLLYAP